MSSQIHETICNVTITGFIQFLNNFNSHKLACLHAWNCYLCLCFVLCSFVCFCRATRWHNVVLLDDQEEDATTSKFNTSKSSQTLQSYLWKKRLNITTPWMVLFKFNKKMHSLNMKQTKTLKLELELLKVHVSMLFRSVWIKEKCHQPYSCGKATPLDICSNQIIFYSIPNFTISKYSVVMCH